MSDKKQFTSYQKMMIAFIAILQFTVILDFMVLSPLGPFLMKDLQLEPNRFSLVVSAYAFSAFASAILTAGFADKFDRKKILLVFYTGFIVGTFFCALSVTYNQLLLARIVTGLFGGVIGSIGFAIITDLFAPEQRGRVMGFVQMAFAASQILGIPIGLVLANWYNWHFPFYAIVCFSIVVGFIIGFKMKPITAHIASNVGKNAFVHLIKTVSNRRYIRGFLATTLLATGGFMLMPFGSEFATKNLEISTDSLPLLYAITGLFTIVSSPFIGKFSDQFGKFRMFVVGTILTITFVAIYTELGPTPLWLAIVLNVILFMGISARMIPASALMTSVPSAEDRGAFMSINSAVQQLSGGIASAVAGMIVYKNAAGKMMNYPTLGFVVIASMIVAVFLIRQLDVMLKKD